MSAPVLVGITLRPVHRAGEPPRLLQNRGYLDAIEGAGAVPLVLPPLRDQGRLRALYEACDAVCLPGGPDVEPRRYGEAPRPEANVVSEPQLDETELLLLRWCIEDERPTLAICRGLQLLNVARGGTLWQDLEGDASLHGHDAERLGRSATAHTVSVAPGSLLAAAAGETNLPVNSLHHQGVRRLGEGLRAVAHAPDGLVEGVELEGHRFMVAVQCHPEEMVEEHPWARRLFRALVAAR